MRLADGITPPIALEPHNATPLYVQLYEGLRDAIVSGCVSAGTRLPSTRGLARDLDVSRTTAIQAYRQLELEGYVASEVGSGTYVSDELPDRVVAATEDPLFGTRRPTNGERHSAAEGLYLENGSLANGSLANGSHANGSHDGHGSLHGTSGVSLHDFGGPGLDGSREVTPGPLSASGQRPWSSGSNGTSPSLDGSRVPVLSARGRQIVDHVPENGHGHDVMPFLPGIPALDKFPYRTWRRIEREVRSPTSELGPGDPSGHPRLRQAIARHVAATRAVQCHPDQVVITAGAQEAFSILAELLFDPGDRVLVEDPGYRAMASAFEALGANLVPVPVDAGGMDVRRGIRTGADARVACVTPSNQFPMGALLTMERRGLLVEWACEAGAWIIEDDYDSEYRFHGAPFPAIRSLEGADARTIYVSTFTKILFPALSLGFVILPESLVEPFRAARSIRDYPPPLLPQLTLARFMEEGHLLRHIRHMRHVYQERASTLRDALSAALPRSVEVPPAAAGMHLVAWLPEGIDDRVLSDRASAQGVLALPVSHFRHAPSRRGGLILGFGSSPMSRIMQSVNNLARAFR